MAKLNIRLTYNKKTGRNDILVDFHSDADALPFEHEEDHKKLVEQILSTSGLSKDELGDIKIKRLTLREKTTVLAGYDLSEQNETTKQANKNH